MAQVFCFEGANRLKPVCIELYTLPFDELFKVPKHKVGLDFSALLGENLGGPYPIPWLEDLGVKVDVQRKIAQMLVVDAAIDQLDEGVRRRFEPVMADLISSLDLPEGVSIRSTSSCSGDSTAA